MVNIDYGISTICRPIYVYATFALILLILGFVITILFTGIRTALGTAIMNLVYIIVCSIILWLICNLYQLIPFISKEAGTIISWIAVIIIILINIGGIISGNLFGAYYM